MKTAEEYLKIWQGDVAVISKDIAIIAMKEYATAVLDEAKFNISLRETNVYTTPDIDAGFERGIDAAMECVNLIKERL